MSLLNYIVDPQLRARYEAQPGPTTRQHVYAEPAYQHPQPGLHISEQSTAIHELEYLFLEQQS